ncbi:protein of unknown function [Pseudorhizobium banfieldiae]|uniref:Uncharacterized protein n=1 Tax=Pseudorhizobium banfieldiae TaxID=1125847 RepID=L0NL02_9HYPH|nr:protein of unknown function [Pseudorhizobium banfieldiae]
MSPGVAASYFRLFESASRKFVARRNLSIRRAVAGGSDFVVVAGDADDAAHVVIVVVFVGFQEGVVVVVAFDLDVVIAHIGKIVAAVIVAVVIRDQFDIRVLGVDFLDLLFLGLFHLHLSRVLLEEGERPGFAGIGRDDRVAVEVVELLAGIRVGTFGSEFRFCHCESLVSLADQVGLAAGAAVNG